jgi:hypothetical protein
MSDPIRIPAYFAVIDGEMIPESFSLKMGDVEKWFSDHDDLIGKGRIAQCEIVIDKRQACA